LKGRTAPGLRICVLGSCLWASRRTSVDR
jgi:hypothetical protein